MSDKASPDPQTVAAGGADKRSGPPRSTRRRLLKWSLALVAAGLVLLVLAWLIVTRSPLTGWAVRSRLQEHTPAEVRLGGAVLTLDGRLVLLDLRLTDRSTGLPGDAAELFTADRVELLPDWGGDELVRSVRVEGAVLRVSQPIAGGPLSLDSLFIDDAPPIGDGVSLPTIAVRDGAIELGEHSAAAYTPLRRLRLEMDILPRSPGETSVRVSGLDGDSSLRARGVITEERIAGRLTGVTLGDFAPDTVPTGVRGLVRRLDPAGEIAVISIDMDWTGAGSIDVELREAAVSLPGEAGESGLAGAPLRISGVSGSVRFGGRLELAETAKGGAAMRASGADGPPVVSARLRGRAAGVPCTLLLDAEGVGESGGLIARLKTDPFVLERGGEAWETMPRFIQQRLDDLFIDPRAEVTPEVWVLHNGGLPPDSRRATAGLEVPPRRPTPASHESPSSLETGGIEVRATADVRDGSLRYRGFAYPVLGASGTIALSGGLLWLDGLVGRGPLPDADDPEPAAPGESLPADAPPPRIVCDGWIGPLGDEAQVDLEIKAMGVVAGEPLLAPLEQRRRAVERLIGEPAPGEPALEPVVMDIAIGIKRRYGYEPRWNERVEVRVRGGEVSPRDLPLRMEFDRATLVVNDDRFSLTETVMRPRAGGAVAVRAEGRLAEEDGGDGLSGVRLGVSASGIPLRNGAGSAGGSAGAGGLLGAAERLKAEPAVAEAIATARRFEIDGLVGAEISLEGDAGADGVRAAGVIRLDEGRATHGEGLAVRRVSGAATLEPGARRITLSLDGDLGVRDEASGPRAGPHASIDIRGDVGLTPDVPSRADIRVDGLDLRWPVGSAVEEFDRDAGRRLADLLSDYDPVGTADVILGIASPGAGAAATLDAIVEVTRADVGVRLNGRRVYTELGGGLLRFRPADGTLEARGARIRLIGSPGGRTSEGFADPGAEPAGFASVGPGDIDVEANGSIGSPGGSPAGGLTIRTQTGDFASPWVRAAVELGLGGQLAETALATEPAGSFGLVARVTRAEAGDGAAGDLVVRGEVKPRRISLVRSGVRTEIAVDSGAVAFGPGGGDVRSVVATGDGWRGTLGGGWSTAGGTGDADLSIGLTAERLSPELVSLLPEGLRTTIDRLSLATSGRIVIERGRIAWSEGGRGEGGGGEGGPALYTEAAIRLEDASLQLGVPIEALHGTVEVRAWPLPGGGTGFVLDLDGARLRAAGVRLSDGRLSATHGEAPGSVVVPSLTARSHGGRLSGEASVTPGGGFSATVAVSGSRLGPILEDLTLAEPALPMGEASSEGADPAAARASDEEQRVSRRLDARVSLTGDIGRPESRRGRGRIVISGGSVLALPLITNVVELANLQLPAGATLNRGQIDFYMAAETVAFERIAVRSPRVTILGWGTLDLPTGGLDLAFRSRGNVRVPGLNTVLEDFRDELATVSVTGTIGDPTFAATVLPNTRRVIGRLFGAGGASDAFDRGPLDPGAAVGTPAGAAAGPTVDEPIRPRGETPG